MAYAQGRVINDADSHIMESLDWLPAYAGKPVRDRLISMRLEAGGSGAVKAIEKALNDPDLIARLEQEGEEVSGSTPEQFGVLLKNDYEKYRTIVATAGVQTK